MFFVLDQQHGAVVTEQPDDLQPKVVISIFFAAIGNQQVERAICEKKLVGLMINLLSAKVPDVDPIALLIAPGKFPSEDVDALSRGVGGFRGQFVIRVKQFTRKASFSGAAFTHDEDLGFVEMSGFAGVLRAEVVVQDWTGIW